MRYFQLLIAISLLGTSVAGASQPKEGFYEQLDDIRALSFIGAPEIADSPEWQPGHGAVPLSIDDAIAAARKFNGESSKEFVVRKIELKPVPKHTSHWHYLILVVNDDKVTNYDIFIVLMSGKVIPALIETRQ